MSIYHFGMKVDGALSRTTVCAENRIVRPRRASNPRPLHYTLPLQPLHFGSYHTLHPKNECTMGYF